jgi:hypothetical protein
MYGQIRLGEPHGQSKDILMQFLWDMTPHLHDDRLHVLRVPCPLGA